MMIPLGNFFQSHFKRPFSSLIYLVNLVPFYCYITLPEDKEEIMRNWFYLCLSGILGVLYWKKNGESLSADSLPGFQLKPQGHRRWQTPLSFHNSSKNKYPSGECGKPSARNHRQITTIVGAIVLNHPQMIRFMVGFIVFLGFPQNNTKHYLISQWILGYTPNYPLVSLW